MTWLDATGLVANTIAAYFLWRGSADLPWEIQTINGKSDAEHAFKRQRRRYANVGFVLLGSGFILQLLARFI